MGTFVSKRLLNKAFCLLIFGVDIERFVYIKGSDILHSDVHYLHMINMWKT